MKSILLLSLLSTSTAYVNVVHGHARSSHLRCGRTCLKERIDDIGDDEKSDNISNDSNRDDDSTASFAQSLSQRISQVEQSESSFVAGLQRRVKSVAKAEEFDMTISNGSEEKSREPIVVDLPVVCFDALLPNQRLSGSTTDPTFINLLRSIGLGGTFMMTSLNSRQRKMRRFGVVARIELVDVDGDDGKEENAKDAYSILSTPTAATFSIVGTRRCEVVGQANKGMKDRIGRWRRGYDPDGEEARLGWGEESFVDKSDDSQSTVMDSKTSVSKRNCDEWSTNQVLIIDDASEDSEATSDAIAKATYLIPLVERWISIASDQTTYDNIDVVARTRRQSGEPGLSVNASALIRNVQQELGPMPSPKCPTAFAVWGAALINPLPALGVATEIRGAVLEAEGAERKLGVLERGLVKSLNNLDGTRPLNM
ncbi:hypothetical protein ACHAXR_007069 [Thalassiosira sp. AJA248-18]